MNTIAIELGQLDGTALTIITVWFLSIVFAATVLIVNVVVPLVMRWHHRSKMRLYRNAILNSQRDEKRLADRLGAGHSEVWIQRETSRRLRSEYQRHMKGLLDWNGSLLDGTIIWRND